MLLSYQSEVLHRAFSPCLLIRDVSNLTILRSMHLYICLFCPVLVFECCTIPALLGQVAFTMQVYFCSFSCISFAAIIFFILHPNFLFTSRLIHLLIGIYLKIIDVKFNGFCISLCMPAVSSASEAIFLIEWVVLGDFVSIASLFNFIILLLYAADCCATILLLIKASTSQPWVYIIVAHFTILPWFDKVSWLLQLIWVREKCKKYNTFILITS